MIRTLSGVGGAPRERSPYPDGQFPFLISEPIDGQLLRPARLQNLRQVLLVGSRLDFRQIIAAVSSDRTVLIMLTFGKYVDPVEAWSQAVSKLML